MYELPLEKAQIKTIKDHQYYVFPAPTPHTNQTDRPTVYANVKALKTYAGKGQQRHGPAASGCADAGRFINGGAD